MARMVIFTDGHSKNGTLVAVNADQVTQAFNAGPWDGHPCTAIYLAGDSERVIVRGDLQTVVAQLNGDTTRSIDTVHLTGWVLNPDHPDRRYRLHPSILTDDQPPAWAPEKPTNGGAE